ncbi:MULTISPECIES: MTAP family purine nucleoside phosphorylase [unclassified Oceanispirochaeta]|uniref:MTAP family purine nucleoside phosphorylase n=1 Tax=unclassified Oceanispirochaeta TaxID=2635722 RepID=UPI000E09540F|nr:MULTISPECIES: MTAP family purine nucleoside phosphorylase [unclassified Oceanispirochaeta]MBF9017566.1 MTAP family purine nucleoside phosphorylase [Oceanispirochaeta sp. M2]NPD74138.1 MTAP family purine nucleoside phosphorylase [Oceanispirochaeta sp. M1]RDG30059.1 S-methyl-5'-thioadenosine phosphorylase [Oceanispirochaeta sp. M1]
MRKAIIGGTGVYDTPGMTRSETVETKYGSVEVEIVKWEGEEIVFLARHGKGHSVPPHLINYRANMMALKQLEVSHIYATCAVGSCNEKYIPGDTVVMNDFLDFTKVRPVTFFDGEEGVKHTDMSDPYCKNLRALYYEEAAKDKVTVKGNAVYVCTEGPRFETAAEIRMYKQMGGDVVGMTNVPEVQLAKEMKMCYSAIGIITNWCTGVISDEIVGHDIMATMASNKDAMTKIFLSILSNNPQRDKCSCRNAIMEM